MTEHYIYGNLVLKGTITNDDTLSKLLVVSADGTVKYRSVSALSTNIPNAISLFVDSISGNDGNDGRQTSPFKTINGALTSINNSGSFICTTANNSNVISGVLDTDNIKLEVGMVLDSSEFPHNTVVLSKGNEGGDNNTIVVSKQAIGTNASSITSYIRLYILECNGFFTPTASIFKDGVYIKNNGKIFWGGFTLFSSTAVLKSNYAILGAGDYIGVNAASQFINMLAAQKPTSTMTVNFGVIDTIGTGVCISIDRSINENYLSINGTYVNARYGIVGYFSGYQQQINFNSYGLLGGIETVNASQVSGGGSTIICGNHTTPSNIPVLTAGNYTTSYANLTGCVSFASNCSHIGRIYGDAHTITDGTNVKALAGSAGKFTCSGVAYVEFSQSATGCTVVVSANATVTANGGYSLSDAGNVSGKLINKGTITAASLKGGGNIDNHSVFNITNTDEFTGTIKNYGLINSASIGGSASEVSILNYGEIVVTDVGIVLNGTANLKNVGSISSTTLNNGSSLVKLNSANCVFDNCGSLTNKSTNASASTIEKTSGKLFFRHGTIVNVSNGKSPIKCTANTSASKDVYIFSAITNCDGSTYGTLMAYDGSTYAPNDLVGGTIYESINF